MRAPASHYLNHGGRLWVTDGVDGMVGTRPLHAAEWEICRMYVHPDHHGTGLAHTLLDHAEAYAVQQGAIQLILWTDTRFTRAHRFYERRGYVRFGPVRALHDLSNTHEFAYASPSPSGRGSG